MNVQYQCILKKSIEILCLGGHKFQPYVNNLANFLVVKLYSEFVDHIFYKCSLLVTMSCVMCGATGRPLKGSEKIAKSCEGKKICARLWQPAELT